MIVSRIDIASMDTIALRKGEAINFSKPSAFYCSMTDHQTIAIALGGEATAPV